MNAFRRKVVLVALALIAVGFLLTGTSLWAQTAVLNGKVLDPQGAVVPGATVSIVSQATGAERSVVSDDEGRFQFPQLAPGLYDVKAELVGFKTFRISGVRLQVDTPVSLDLKLSLGEVTEIVTVASTTEKLMNEVDGSLGNAFNTDQIVDLPLNERNVYQLLSVQPGVTESGEVAGARSDQSNLTLDGIDVNEQQSGEAFTSVLRVTPDSVQEFKVTTSSPNSSQGRSSGAQVSLVTKSGTNEYHGSLYHYHRNTATAANTFFNNRVEGDPDLDGRPGIATPKLIRNLFGGSVGGPVVKDKAFFFFNYEGRTDRSESSDIHIVPMAHLGEGQMKYINDAGNLVTLSTDQINALYPAVGVNPTAVAALRDAASRYPVNDSGLGDGINTGAHRFNASTPIDYNTYIARLDLNLNEGQTLYVRSNYQWDHRGLLSYWPDTPAPTRWDHPFGIAVGHSWMIQPTLVNTFRYGLTRQGFSQQGDSDQNDIGFRFVFWPRDFSRTLSRTTPLQNFTNDTSWIKGNHTLQFGTNVRLIDNNRQSFSGAYDSAVTNPSFYAQSGAVLDMVPDFGAGQQNIIRNSATALIGRYSQYSGNYTFGADGSLLPPGSPSARTFATEEYEFYFEDTWQTSADLTLNLGLRWGYNRPVFESTGFQVKPDVSLGGYFEQRKASALRGVPYNEAITIDTAGPVYGKPGYYDADWNNFSPRISFAYSPSFDDGILHAIFGNQGESVVRGGFAMMYDRIGSQLAVSFDLANTLGFSSSETIAANTYDVSGNPAPLFTGYDQDIRSLPGLSLPASIAFPLMTPADEAQRIESSLDDTITTPVNYNWNLSIGRELPGGLYIEASYLGRSAKNLLAQRDIMHLNNITDPKSGIDWYTAAHALMEHRWADTPIEQIPAIPFFENLFPNLPTSGAWWVWDPSLTATQNVFSIMSRDGWDMLDWTYTQDLLDDINIPNLFFHPQYAALSTWSTIASSDYHAFTFTMRERFRESLTFDLNYTWSKSMDNASGLQNAVDYDASGFILNPLYPDDYRSPSDFDINHIVNSNWLWTLPIGRGKDYLSDMPGVLEAILGGWNVNGVFRWNSGLPMWGPIEGTRWATNWNAQSFGTRVRDPKVEIHKDGANPNMFADQTYAYQSLRDAYAGESGDRNVYRIQSYITVDLGINKRFRMPYNEDHSVVFRWEVFNATNTQKLDYPTTGRTSWGFDPDPQSGLPTADFGNINDIQGRPRVMQFGLRYEF